MRRQVSEVLHHAASRSVRARDFKRCRIGEIECDAALVAIEAEVGRALAANLRMMVMAGIVAPVGVFDLDHFGAEIRQHLRAGRACHDPGEIDNQKTIQGRRLSRGICSGNCGLAVIPGISPVILLGETIVFRRDFKPLTGPGGVAPNPCFAGRDLPPT